MSNDRAPKVLMISYACNPDGSGEHWLGWGWAEQAAKNYHVHLVTTPNARDAVTREAARHGITPHFVTVPGWMHFVTGWFGRFGAWLRKVDWAYRAHRFTQRLHAREGFALAHQTTFHTFRIPFLATRLGIPAVWGPIAGGEHIPYGFYKFIGPLFLPESLRRVFNRVWLRLPVVQETLKRTDVIFVSNHTTKDYLGAEFAGKCIVVTPNAMREEDRAQPVAAQLRPGDGTFRLLYVGNCLATRAMPLAFAALARTGLKNWQLDILGTGSGFQFWQQQAEEHGVAERVKFRGQIPREKLDSYYGQADVLVFPALRDSGGSALLEAMSKGVPVLCLDWGGPTEMVEPDSGVKVPVTTPDETIQRFADALVQLERDPQLRARLGVRAAERARTHFTWDTKRQLLETTYQRLLAGK